MNPVGLSTKLQKLNSLYLIQLGIYKSILRLTQEQFTIVNDEDQKEALLEKINKRLSLVNKIDKINPEINLIKSQVLMQFGIKEFNMTSIREKVNGPVVDELGETLKEIGDTLKLINQLDHEFRGKIESQLPVPKAAIKPNMQAAQNAYKFFSPSQDKS